MADEFKGLRDSEIEAWERCAQQYQYAYAFIRLRYGGQERDWINSFGELALERYTEQRSLFVFFSDLEISFVTKILDQNVRTLNKDRAALEVLIGAWCQTSADKIEHLKLEPKVVNVPVEGLITQDLKSDIEFFSSTVSEDEVNYCELYQHGITNFSLALHTAAAELSNLEASKTILDCICALLNVAAQQGCVSLYHYLHEVQKMANEVRSEDLLFDMRGIERLRDCLTSIKTTVSDLFPNSEIARTGCGLPFFNGTKHNSSGFDDASLLSINSAKIFNSHLPKLCGHLRIEALAVRDFANVFDGMEVDQEFTRRYASTAGRLERYSDALQDLTNELSTVSLSSILERCLSKPFFSRASALLPLCCKFEGDEVRIPRNACSMIHELFECLYQFLNRFPDSLDFVQFCEAPLNITLRQSTSDFTFSIDGSHDFEHWQIFVRIVREQMKDIRSQANFIVKDQSSFGLLLRFPFESVTSQNLLVESAGERLALSVRTLMETGRVDVQRVQKIGSKRFVPFRDGVIPLVSLGQILKFDQNKKTNTLVADIENQNSQLCPQWLEFVIAKNSNNLIAFEVDSVLGQREMVVREVSKIVPKFSGLLGVSVLEDERVSMVLDVTQLITSDELSRGDYARKVS